MTNCRSCGAGVPESGAYCSRCGARLNLDPNATVPAASPPTDPSAITTPAPSPGTDFSAITTPAPAGTSASRPPTGFVTSSAQLPSDGRFLPGTLLSGRYRVIALLGRGGMGEVYRADDLTLGQPVALKFLPPSAAADPDLVVRFLAEVRIARRVSHANVCRVYDIGEAEGLTFLSMEYVDGEDLSSLLRRIGRLPGDKALEIARQLCAGLAAAHREGVLHRDLKPANVMIDGRGRAVVTDFGLAGLADQVQGNEVRSGTPAYMAPEQLEGREVSVRSDIYSLGLVLYELFTGRPAFASGSLADLLRTRREGAPSNPSTWVKDLEPVVERVILRCLAADPAGRPASALAVAAALPGGDPLAAALAAGETPTPQMVAAAGETGGLAPRQALLGFLAVLAGLALFTSLWIRESGLERMKLENPPVVLAQKSRQLIARLAGAPRDGDHGGGFAYDSDLLEFLDGGNGARPDWDALLPGRPSVLTYWYRQSPRPMVPVPRGLDRSELALSPDNPPQVLSGMINLRLDPAGRLVYWQAMPAELDTTSVAPGSSVAPEWGELFAAAGLDTAAFQPAPPNWVSLAAADTRAAWTGTWPGTTYPLRIEAAAWRGQPVFFSLLGSWSRPDRMPRPGSAGRQTAASTITVVLLVSVVLAGFLVTRRNLLRGRSDTKGARRLAGAVFVIDLAVWPFLGHPVPGVNAVGQFVQAVSIALLAAGSTWGMYVALEPYVRRHWPQTIISWSRLLSGRVRDPLVGRDVLTGVLLGTAWAVIFAAGYLLQVRSGATPQFGTTDYLLGMRTAIGTWLGNVVGSILGTLTFFLVLFLLRILLRNRAAAVVGFVAIFAGINTLSSGHPWLALPIWILIYSIAALAVVRFGLVALAVGVFTANMLLNQPLTLDTSAWYAGTSFAALLFFAALAGWGFRESLAGQRLFREGLLE